MEYRSEAFDLQGYLAHQRLRVEEALARWMEALARRAPPRLVEAMRYSLLAGGKRIRPILCLSFAEAVGRASGAGGRLAEDAACALEMIHTYSLVHDDLPAMDNDDFRRGKPTSHRMFGEDIAILAGDALFTEAFVVLTSGDEPSRLALSGELSRAASAAGMVGGQLLDIAKDRRAEEGYLVQMHRLKTGALIRAACRMGVIAAGGSAAQIEVADAYGDAVGLAFQIADDVLDAVGDPKVMGKPTRADAAAKRDTFPAVLGLERSQAMARELVERAVASVRPLEEPEGPLAAIARYVVGRQS